MIGAKIAQRFQAEAEAQNTRPVVIYLPSKSAFRGGVALEIKKMTLTRMLEHGVDVVDMTECLARDGGVEHLFLAQGAHYSGTGNRTFAECLVKLLQI